MFRTLKVSILIAVRLKEVRLKEAEHENGMLGGRGGGGGGE